MTKKFQKRREEILELIRDIGLWNINQSELATKYGVSRQQISKDVKALMEGLRCEDANNVGVAVMIGLKSAFREIQLIMQKNKDDPKLMLKAATTLAQISASISGYMQNAQLIEIRREEDEEAKKQAEYYHKRLTDAIHNDVYTESIRETVEKIEGHQKEEKKLMLNKLQKAFDSSKPVNIKELWKEAYREARGIGEQKVEVQEEDLEIKEESNKARYRPYVAI